MRDGRTDSPRPERSDSRAPNFDQNKGQLEALNAKLDRILGILEPKVVAPIVKDPELVSGPKTEKIADKVELTKIKKAVKKAASTKKK